MDDLERTQAAPQGRLSLNGFQLKLIALALMTVDHLAAYHAFPMGPQLYAAMRAVGRVAAPLFLFTAVEGLRHTRSRPRYLLRLYLAGAIFGAANWALAAALPRAGASIGNIFPTFFYMGLFVACIDALRARPRPGTALAALGGLILPFGLAGVYARLYLSGREDLFRLLNALLPSPLAVEYSIIFSLLGVAWYYLNDRRWNALAFLALSLLSALVPLKFFLRPPVTLVPLLRPAVFTAYHLFSSDQWCMVFALPLMWLYNGARGRSMKYLFYLYYPLHQYLFFFLGLLWK